MNAWLFQDRKQLAKLGDACPWSVGWYDPDGKRKSKSIGSKSLATKAARKVEGQLAAGTYENESRASWDDFTAVYESRALAGMNPTSREAAQYALNHFARIINPAKVRSITTATLADYVAKRRVERTRKAETAPVVSPATVNKELRTLRAVLRKAHKWGYLPRVPEFEFLREPGKLATYVTPEDFAALYGKCDTMRWPGQQAYSAGDWWRGALIFGFMTGWRIGSILSLRWDDVDLDKGQALSRAEHNKGKRDQFIALHPVVVDHLTKLRSFGPVVFPWDHGRRGLYTEFAALQAAAGVTAGYGFHDLRRGFATLNAENLTADALQTLMQHRDYQTTQRYISMARQLKPAVEKLFVPKLTAATA